MEFTELGDSAVPAGRLVFWTPAAPASAWADDPRTPALVHEHHVRTAAARGPGYVEPAWIGVSFAVGRAGRHQLGAALTAWLRGHEHLRSTLVPTPGHCVRRTLPAGAVTLRQEDAGVFADGASARRQIEAFFDRRADPLGWPQMVFATVEGAGGTTVFAGADHGVVDAYTLAMVPGQIRAALTGRAEGRAGPTYLDFGAEERDLIGRLPRGPERTDHWEALLDDARGGTPAFPLPLGTSGTPLAQRSAYRRLLDGPAAARFAAASRASGGTTAAGMLACLALATADVAGERPLAAIGLANTRTGPWRSAPGWFVGLHPVRIPAAAGAPFAGTVALAAAELRRRGPGPGSSPPHISRMLRREIRPRFVVSYIDVRRVAGTPPQRGDTMLRSRVHGPAEVYVWLTRSDHGVHLSTRFPDTPVARANVERFVLATAHAATRAADGHRAEALPTPA
ncbi:condensation protein [Streptomyces luteoverticillatus]|uniref:Condensation protein n=1 Tax=Streptomyces luteoverticillatus TaxID=66425 RepID=A0A3Q9G0Y1_STRLT|nr:condensation protein [Streptomyces luteoverticillatus]AZQ74775.1 condensation protein [Streptomyces luteoverticillatus]